MADLQGLESRTNCFLTERLTYAQDHELASLAGETAQA